MMTAADQRKWAAMLGRTAQQQAIVIHDLLLHATNDGMTAEDRTICVRQLRRLRREIDAAQVSPAS